jgi:hypothetical protein
MCNCNQKRIAYSTQNDMSSKGLVKVMLTQNDSLVLNGDITGRTYVFKTTNDVNWVDSRDVISMKKQKGLQIFN